LAFEWTLVPAHAPLPLTNLLASSTQAVHLSSLSSLAVQLASTETLLAVHTSDPFLYFRFFVLHTLHLSSVVFFTVAHLSELEISLTTAHLLEAKR